MANSKLKVIIAGSRDIFDFKILDLAIDQSGFNIWKIVNNGDRGVNKSSVIWAKQQEIPVVDIVPDWSNLKARGAIVKTNNKGQYNAKAAVDNQSKIVDYIDAAIVIYDEGNQQLEKFIELIQEKNKPLYVYEI
jgi:hypothetical protein